MKPYEKGYNLRQVLIPLKRMKVVEPKLLRDVNTEQYYNLTDLS